MKKVVSVSLWGNDNRYIQGATKNAFLSQKYYPDWEYRIYAEDHLHSSLTNIPAVVLSPVKYWNNGRFWRFLPAFEQDVDIMISRDCDSRIGERESRCVKEWIASDKNISIIRDHPRHYDFPILAGMWGIKNGFSEDIKKSILKYSGDPAAYLVDQIWLANEVWSKYKDDAFIHGINEIEWMRTEISGNDFVGQGYDENNIPLYPVK